MIFDITVAATLIEEDECSAVMDSIINKLITYLVTDTQRNFRYFYIEERLVLCGSLLQHTELWKKA